MKPKITAGKHHLDERGKITYNNDFNALGIKRIYSIENVDIHYVRAWQGHKIEQRWFSAVSGTFLIKLIKIDNWNTPAKDLVQLEFILGSENLDILHVPAGFVSSIQAIKEDSRLMLFADYGLGEIEDEYRFPVDYFK